MVISQTTELSHLALIYHVINHGLAKTLLFLTIGCLYKAYHTKDLKVLKGVLRGDKKLAIAVFIGLFSLGGFPGTGGFVSKLLILLVMYNALSIDLVWKITILGIVLINTLLGFIGYLMLIKSLIFDESEENIPESPISIHLKIPVYILSICILILGIFPNYILEMIDNVSKVGG